MNPKQTAPLLTALAPAALAAPPVAILGIILGAGLLWLLSDKKKTNETPAEIPMPLPDPVGSPAAQASTPPVPAYAPVKRVKREDLAEALAYGEVHFTRKEAVAALEALGFRKTAAYKALSPEGKFGSLIEFTSDGVTEWKG